MILTTDSITGTSTSTPISADGAMRNAEVHLQQHRDDHRPDQHR